MLPVRAIKTLRIKLFENEVQLLRNCIAIQVIHYIPLRNFSEKYGLNYSLIVASLHLLTCKFCHFELSHLH